MRFKHVFVLTALVSVLLIAAGAARVAAFAPASAPPLLIDAAFTCGMFDGSFSCRAAPGEEAHGKNASPGVSRTPNARIGRSHRRQPRHGISRARRSEPERRAGRDT